jgi:hypothetical protein
MSKTKPKSKKPSADRQRQSVLQRQQRAAEARMTGLLDSATSQRYGGSERALRDEIARTGAHQGTINDVYAAYQAQVAQLAAQQQQAMAQAAQAQAGVAQGVVAGQAALGTQQQQASQETAQRYGLDGGALAGQAGQLAGQLGAVNGARMQAQAGSTAAIGLAQGDRLRAASLAGVGGQKRDSDHNQAELAMLGQKRLDLESDKGNFRVTQRQAIEQQDSENALAAQALGVKDEQAQRDNELELLGLKLKSEDSKRSASLKRADLAQRRKESQIDNARADRKLDLDMQKAIRTAAQRDRELDIQAKKAGGGGVPALSPAQKNAWRQKKAKVIELRKRFDSMLKSGRYKDSAAVTVALKGKGSNFTDSEINMARDLALLGKLSPTNVTAAQGYFPGGYVPGGFRAG